MRTTLAVSLCLSLALLGACKGKEAADISESLKEKGTKQLMEEVANDSYDAPADGRLTDAQIQMYLKVREQETKIAQVAKQELEQHGKAAEKKGEKSLAGMMDGLKALGSAADFLTADIRAAKELGYNTQEYLWVKGQVLEASTAAMAEQFNQSINENVDKAYEDTKKAYEAATDEATKKMYGDLLAGYDKSRQEMKAQQQTDVNPATAYNRQLLTKYEDALNAFAQEMAKYQDTQQPAQQQ